MGLANKKIQLRLDKTYTLEDIHLLSNTALNRMCWRFDVSGWVGNVPNLLRQAISDIPCFMELYSSLNAEQQLLFSFVCEYAGNPVTMDKIYQRFASKMSKKIQDTIVRGLIQEGWLLEGENPHSVLALPEFEFVLKAVPAFNGFLRAELPREHEATVNGGQFFSDLVEMAAFLYVEKPKLTIKGFLPKTILRRLVSRLSDAATYGWEDYAHESLYTDKMIMLIKGLLTIHALKSTTDQAANYYYGFDVEQWENFVFSPSPHRLLQALSWEFSRMNDRRRGCLPFVVSLLKNAAQLEGRWQTGASLMIISSMTNSSVVFAQQDPFRSEDWLELVVLEPLVYLGLFEKADESLETPWLRDSHTVRSFWRLTPLGLALGEWLTAQNNESAAVSQMSKVDIFSKGAVSDFASLLAKWQQILPAEIEQQLIIQPDLSFLVPRYAPPYLLWILSVFATTQIQDYVYQGSFSRDSVLRALKGGVAAGDLFDVIQDHCTVPPADNVIRSLKQWCATYDRTIFAKVVVLACDTPEMATEIMAQSKLANHVIGQIGPQTLLIKPESEGVIRKWLEKKNWVPRPGVTTGGCLYKWLDK